MGNERRERMEDQGAVGLGRVDIDRAKKGAGLGGEGEPVALNKRGSGRIARLAVLEGLH